MGKKNEQYLVGGAYGQYLSREQADNLLRELRQTQPGTPWAIFERQRDQNAKREKG